MGIPDFSSAPQNEKLPPGSDGIFVDMSEDVFSADKFRIFRWAIAYPFFFFFCVE